MPLESAAVIVRPLEHTDLPAALAIQSQSYPAFLREDEAAFASRLSLSASHCLAATRDGVLIGYLLAYGWPSEGPSPIGTILATDGASEVLFVHDLASLPEAQGSGVGRTLAMRAFELAALNGLGEAQLIAVEGAASYWRRLGFAEAATSDKLAAAIAQYGSDARWMTREIVSFAPADDAGRRVP